MERAQFDADRARRHYQRVEPENRLVARQLVHDWEAALQAQQRLQEDYQRFSQAQPKRLSSEERHQIQQMANSLPLLWAAPTTTMAQRKDVIRQMIDGILMTVVGNTEQVQVTIQWAGGDSSQAQITRPVAKWTQLSYYPQLCQRLEQLTQANLTTHDIMDCLHQDGFRPPKRRQTFNPEMVQTLIRRLGFRSHSATPAKAPLPPPEWWLPDLAAKLDMPTMTLYNWVQRGWVKARQPAEPPKHWIIWADEAELERLRTHRQCPNGEILRQRWQGETPSMACPPD